MLLSDRDIRSEITNGRVAVEPFEEAMIQPSSVDVRLDKFFRVFENHKYSVIDPSIEQSELTREVIAEEGEAFILHPGEFVLASTYEVITLPDDIAGRLEGKSSLGRLGLAHPLNSGLYRSRILGPHHARTFKCCKPASEVIPRHENRSALSD